MRWMNSTEPKAKPTMMASVRSRKIVSRKVASRTAASPRDAPRSVAKACLSNIAQATTASTPARLAKGMKPASGAANTTNSSRKTE
jgi:hypothetical protein